MSQPDIKSLFKTVREKEKHPAFTNGFKPKQGNTYEIRLIPTTDAKNTYVPYVEYSVSVSASTGKYSTCLSPKTNGKFDRDPIAELRSKLYHDGKEELRSKLKRSQKVLINVFIVKDPVNPENEGKVLPYHMPKQVWDFIETEIKNESEDAIGEAMFNASREGHDFVLAIGSKPSGIKDRDWPDYSKCRFSRLPKPLPNGVTAEQAYEMAEQNLVNLLRIPTPEAAHQYIREHFLGGNSEAPVGDTHEDDDLIGDGVETVADKAVKTAVASAKKNVVVVENDDDSDEAVLASLRKRI